MHTMKIVTTPTEEESIARGTGWLLLTLVVILTMLALLSSCNTTRGFGRDVEKVGSKIERAADKVAGN